MEGFWLIPGNAKPVKHYNFPEHPLSPTNLNFINKQVKLEKDLGHFSKPFYGLLLLGIINVPVHSVPKKSGKSCMLVDHSAGK